MSRLLHYSSQLETSQGRVLNYSAISSAQSTTSRNQLRLVGFIDKSPTNQSYSSSPTFCATHILSIGKLKTSKPCLVWPEAVQPRTLSALEKDSDHLLPLEDGVALARRGAIVSDNYSDLAAHMTPIISNPRGLVRGSDWLGRFEHRKGMKPSRFLKSSPP
jgi:hypothetical protein